MQFHAATLTDALQLAESDSDDDPVDDAQTHQHRRLLRGVPVGPTLWCGAGPLRTIHASVRHVLTLLQSLAVLTCRSPNMLLRLFKLFTTAIFVTS